VHPEHRRRRTELLELAVDGLAGARRRQEALDLRGGESIGDPGVAVALGRSVPVHLVAVDVDDYDGVAQLVDRACEATALFLQVGGVVGRLRQCLFESGDRRLVATRGAQPNRPVM
jgi:hypothetical protein